LDECFAKQADFQVNIPMSNLHINWLLLLLI
jgi:hypothetical protein